MPQNEKNKQDSEMQSMNKKMRHTCVHVHFVQMKKRVNQRHMPDCQICINHYQLMFHILQTHTNRRACAFFFQTNQQQKTTFTTFNRKFFLSLFRFELGNLIFLLNSEKSIVEIWLIEIDKSKPIKRILTHSLTQSFAHKESGSVCSVK